MSYNARLRATQNRVWASSPTNYEPLDTSNGRKYHGWKVGSSQASSIGIPSRLVRIIGERTTPLKITDGKIIGNDKNLVVVQNTLSGVGRHHSQFNSDISSQSRGGIKSARYYINGS